VKSALGRNRTLKIVEIPHREMGDLKRVRRDFGVIKRVKGSAPKINQEANIVKLFKSLAVTSALLMTGGITLAAAPPQQTDNTPAQTRAYQSENMNNNGGTRANTATHEEMGTVSSVNNSKIVLKHKYMGKEEKTSFKVTSNTQEQGKINAGSHVVIYYRTNNKGNRVATRVEPWHG
jgi:hypothetical protein